MSKSDLAARPIYHHLKDSIEAYLTIVFTALAIARDLQTRSGWSLKKIIRALRPLQHVTIRLAGQQLEAEPALTDDVAELLASLGQLKRSNSGLDSKGVIQSSTFGPEAGEGASGVWAEKLDDVDAQLPVTLARQGACTLRSSMSLSAPWGISRPAEFSARRNPIGLARANHDVMLGAGKHNG